MGARDPCWIFAGVLGYALTLLAFGGWFVAIILGRLPRGMRDLSAYCLRFQTQTEAYSMLLTARYPHSQTPSEPAIPAATVGRETHTRAHQDSCREETGGYPCGEPRRTQAQCSRFRRRPAPGDGPGLAATINPRPGIAAAAGQPATVSRLTREPRRLPRRR